MAPTGASIPGGDEPPDEDHCNFNKNVNDTTPIGRYSPQGDSPYGSVDMAVNIWEWCQSLLEPYPYQADDGRENLRVPDQQVLHGGTFIDEPISVRCAMRIGDFPDVRHFTYGFRVARGPLG